MSCMSSLVESHEEDSPFVVPHYSASLRLCNCFAGTAGLHDILKGHVTNVSAAFAE